MNGISSTTYSYDHCGLLKQINFPGGKWEKFYYDGLGRRIKTEYYTGTTLTNTRKFVYLDGSVIRELNGSGQTVRDYIRESGLGGAIGSIIYCKEGSNYYYFHYNHKGDVISVTDADKEEVAYYEYDAWGNTMTEAGSWSSPYRFSTKEWDGDSGLYYFGARYYSPEIGRWTQSEPLIENADRRAYDFVFNDPVSLIDPSGLKPTIPKPRVPTPKDIYECMQEALGENYFNIWKGLNEFIQKRNMCKEIALWCNDPTSGPSPGHTNKRSGQITTRQNVIESSNIKQKFLNCLLRRGLSEIPGMDELIPEPEDRVAKFGVRGVLTYLCVGTDRIWWAFEGLTDVAGTSYSRPGGMSERLLATGYCQGAATCGCCDE